MYFKRILSLLLVTPLILGTISACSCGNNAITDNINDENEIIENRKIIKNKEKEEQFNKIAEFAKEELDKEKNILEVNNKIDVNENGNEIEKQMSSILNIGDKKTELNYDSSDYRKFFDYFNNKIKDIMTKVNAAIMVQFDTIYDDPTFSPITLVESQTQIVVNDIKIDDLNELLKREETTSGKAKQLDIIYHYNIRYDDEMTEKQKTLGLNYLISNDIAKLTNLEDEIAKEISKITADKLEEKYGNYHVENDEHIKEYLKAESFNLSHARDFFKMEAFTFFKNLIKEDKNFSKLKDDEINYGSADYFLTPKSEPSPLDVENRRSTTLDNIFGQLTNNSDAENFYFQKTLYILSKLQCKNDECSAEDKYNFYEQPYSLSGMKIYGLPLKGKIIKPDIGYELKMTLSVLKQTLHKNLRIYIRDIIDFFNYYQIQWGKDEIVIKIEKNKRDIFDELLAKVNSSENDKLYWSSRILSENFKSNNNLSNFKLFAWSDSGFSHHWEQPDENTVICWARSKIGNVETHANSSWISFQPLGNTGVAHSFYNIFIYKKALKIVYQA